MYVNKTKRCCFTTPPPSTWWTEKQGRQTPDSPGSAHLRPVLFGICFPELGSSPPAAASPCPAIWLPSLRSCVESCSSELPTGLCNPGLFSNGLWSKLCDLVCVLTGVGYVAGARVPGRWCQWRNLDVLLSLDICSLPYSLSSS